MKRYEERHLYYISLEAIDDDMFGAYSFCDEFYGTLAELRREIQSYKADGCKLLGVKRA